MKVLSRLIQTEALLDVLHANIYLCFINNDLKISFEMFRFTWQ